MNDQVKTPEAPAGANVVTVGCKLPFGLLAEVGRRNQPGYRSFQFKGTNHKDAILMEGFAMTRVPADFWREWLDYTVEVVDGENKGKKIRVQPNKNLPAIQKGFIYAHSEQASVEAHFLSRADQRTGLEPADPEKLGPGLKTLEKND